jgi:hypothetical protein
MEETMNTDFTTTEEKFKIITDFSHQKKRKGQLFRENETKDDIRRKRN